MKIMCGLVYYLSYTERPWLYRRNENVIFFREKIISGLIHIENILEAISARSLLAIIDRSVLILRKGLLL